MGPWNYPYKAIVLPRIGITRGLHWSNHKTALVKPLYCHTLALHGVYISRFMKLPIWTTVLPHIGITWGLTLVGPWNCTWKAIVLPHIGIAWGLHWSTNETAHINHSLVTHWYYMGSTLVGTWNCKWKAIVLPHIGIAWGLHWSTHEIAHINHCLATHWYYMGFTLVGPWN